MIRTPSPQAARGQDFVVSRRRRELVDRLRKEGIHDAQVLAAMEKVPRHEFVDELLKSRAYENTALPIGSAQTISQPIVVALMTQALLSGQKLKRVLEVGTGSGYQTAVLAELVENLFTVERIKPLTEQARLRLAQRGYRNVHFGYADGMNGWSPYAPYDGIMVTAGAESVPRALTEQLAVGGRMLIPVGPQGRQSLRLIERSTRGLVERDLAAVSFVPLLAGRD